MNVTNTLSPAIPNPLPVRGYERPPVTQPPLPVASSTANTSKTFANEPSEKKGDISHTAGRDAELRPNPEIPRIIAILGIEMMLMESETQKFMKSLTSFNPELAGKDFGYTLGDDSRLKILDPQGNLTPRETEWLTKALNAQEQALQWIRGFARLTFELARDYQTHSSEPRELNKSDANQLVNYRSIDPTAFWEKFDQWAGSECSMSNGQHRSRSNHIDIDA